MPELFELTRTQFVIVTGFSGAGKSTALKTLEDMGYLAIDNLPPALIDPLTQLLQRSEGTISKVAVVCDVRGLNFFDTITEVLRQAAGTSGISISVLFLACEQQVLVNRFKETRRKHPLSNRFTLVEAIREEMYLLSNIRKRADFIVDTSFLSLSELKQKLQVIFSADNNESNFFINLISFGFKHGLPHSADLVFDVRFLNNPFYLEELRQQSGQNKAVQDYIEQDERFPLLFNKLTDLIEFLIPNYILEGKYQLEIAIGCTGGHHRSVFTVEKLGAHLQEKYQVFIKHRDIDE